MAPITRSAARRQQFEIHFDSSAELNKTSYSESGESNERRCIPIEKKLTFRDVTNYNGENIINTSKNQRFNQAPQLKINSINSNHATASILEDNCWSAEDIELLEEIGGGAQSRVFRGRHKATNEIYAIKVIDYNCNRKYADRELKIHLALDYPGVVKLHGHYRNKGPNREHLCLVLDFCPNTMLGILREQDEGRISEQKAAEYLVEVVDTLEYLHNNKIIHRDIKLANILVSQDGKAKIADFGISTRVRDPAMRKTIIGTEGYMAPEIEMNTKQTEAGKQYLRSIETEGASASFQVPIDVELYESQYTSNVDLYSLGATLYAMLTGKLPEDKGTDYSSGFGFCFDTEPEDLFDFEFAQEIVSIEALDLILGLLEEDPASRLSLAEVKKHPWFQTHVDRW